ncbi:hypothetical protein M5K25_001756 [Dendrobium thyrsiflorum]|uniref:Uncharacterized protein n=1 Tax=Dendrobium thyrsiflorum TaxID=117978 RepID=A0ABD0VSM1_DENTH
MGYGNRYSLLGHHTVEELQKFGLTEAMIDDQIWTITYERIAEDFKKSWKEERFSAGGRGCLCQKVGRNNGSLLEEEGSLPLLKGSLPSPGSGEKGHRFSAFVERLEKEWFSAFTGRLEGRAVLYWRKRLPLSEGWKEQRFSAGGRRFSTLAERLEGRVMDLQNSAFSVQLGHGTRIQLANAIFETGNSETTIQFGSVDFLVVAAKAAAASTHDVNSEGPARRPRSIETSTRHAHLSAPQATTTENPR